MDRAAAVGGTGEELQLISIEYQPGVAAPPHLHPVAGLVYSLEGSAESQYEGGAMKTFAAGDPYQDQAKKKHLVFRNTSQTKPLRFLVACKITEREAFAKQLP